MPDDVRAYFAERAAAKRAARRERDAELESWRRREPAAAASWDAARARRVPDDLDARLAEGRDGVADATRNHSAVMLETARGRRAPI